MLNPDSIDVQPVASDSWGSFLKSLSELPRHEPEYMRAMAAVRLNLNLLEPNQLKGIDLTDLIQRNSPFVQFRISLVPYKIPYDLHYGLWLNSHLRNRLLVILKGHRRYLRKDELEILNLFERARSFIASVDFSAFNLDRHFNRVMAEINHFESLGKLGKRIPRILDHYFSALRTAQQLDFELQCIQGLLNDVHHSRRSAFLRWFADSYFHGNADRLLTVTNNHLAVIDERSAAIIKNIGELLGSEDVGQLPSPLLDIGLRRDRGSHLMLSQIDDYEKKLLCMNFDRLKPQYDVTELKQKLRQYKQNDDRSSSQACAKLYLECLQWQKDLNEREGPIACSIKADFEHGLLSKEELRDAKAWQKRAAIDLKMIQVETYQTLVEDFRQYPNKYVPKKLMDQLLEVQDRKHQAEALNVAQIRSRLKSITAGAVTHHKLEKLVEWYQDIQKLKTELTEFRQIEKMRDKSIAYKEFENMMYRAFEEEAALDEVLKKGERQLFQCFRAIKHSRCKPVVLDQVFLRLSNATLRNLRHLDYGVIDSKRFESMFEMALRLPKADAIFQLDTLLREIHLVPRHDMLQSALDLWRNRLSPEEFQKKQAFLFQNELELQKLVQNIRNELREGLEDASNSSWTRRNRFEVFGMGDYFGPNIQPLLDGLIRLVPEVSSIEECRNLIENIEFVESKVQEAHIVTSPDGTAFREVKRLARAMGSPVLNQLLKDFEVNQRDLNHVLNHAKDGLESSHILLKRLGLPNGDNEYLSVAVHLEDLDKLMQVYDFLDDIEISDIKRFVLVYNHRIRLMEDLYERAGKRDRNLPVDMLKLMNTQAFKDFQADYRIKDTLKFEILAAMPNILEAESQLLNRMLNFVRCDKIQTKSTYQGILQIVACVGPKDTVGHKKLRQIWAYLQSSLENYRPDRFSQNFSKNAQRLLMDVSNLHQLPFPLIKSSNFLNTQKKSRT